MLQQYRRANKTPAATPLLSAFLLVDSLFNQIPEAGCPIANLAIVGPQELKTQSGTTPLPLSLLDKVLAVILKRSEGSRESKLTLVFPPFPTRIPTVLLLVDNPKNSCRPEIA